MKPYLFLYNISSCLGWAYVVYLVAMSLLTGDAAQDMWEKVAEPLRVVQTLALLEVAHSLFGLVRSPLITTVMQVGSRISLLWIYSNSYVACQQHWSLYWMIGSWALVEVPRYLFYALNLYTSKVPFPIFWLRYTLFMVLYPTGILGEIFQIVSALPTIKTRFVPGWYASLFLLTLYIPGSPFMFTHMIVQRKRAFANRKSGSVPAREPTGLVFPKTSNGDRSTTALNKGAFAAAVGAVDKEAAERIKKERSWRFKYNRYVVENVRISARKPTNCLQIAKAGLDYLHNNFEFIRDGKTYKFAEAMSSIKGAFETGVIEGQKPKPQQFEYEVPYLDKTLKGKALLDQLDKWVQYGTIEPEARDAIALVAKNPKWLDLSDKYFVLLGAGSAMGPLLVLMALGANVIAIDLDRPAIWKRLIGIAKNSCGKMIFPLSKPQTGLTEDELHQSAGCNLFTQTPEIQNWLKTVEPGRELVIGGYAYLDGALHVQVSLAMDAIMHGVYRERPNTTLAFLCTPTDCHVIPQEAHDAMVENHKNAPWWQQLISSVSGERFLRKNALAPVKANDGEMINLVDGLVVAQGPNYALAKRMQHWRAMVARSDGCAVSSNVAPSTATRSVVHNKQFAAAYGGMHHFKPMEIMYQETSNAVMGALLIHDIRNTKSVAHPQTALTNPLKLFTSGSFHGGIWRCAYKINSMGEVAAVSFYLKQSAPYLLGFITTIVAAGSYIALNGPPHTWEFLPF